MRGGALQRAAAGQEAGAVGLTRSQVSAPRASLIPNPLPSNVNAS